MSTNSYDAAHQAESLVTATRVGTHWTQRELDQLSEMRKNGETARQAAQVLKRTLYGVRAVRTTTERRDKAAAAARRPILPYDRGFTTLEEMGF